MKRLALTIALGVACASAGAAPGWWVSSDVEHFRWDEATDPSVTETGPRYGLIRLRTKGPAIHATVAPSTIAIVIMNESKALTSKAQRAIHITRPTTVAT